MKRFETCKKATKSLNKVESYAFIYTFSLLLFTNGEFETIVGPQIRPKDHVRTIDTLTSFK